MTTTKLPNASNPYRTGVVNGATFTIGAETANAITVNIQLKDGAADAYQRAAVFGYLSGDANGDTIIATGPTSIAAGTDGVYSPIVAVKTFNLISEADGDIDLVITLSSGAATYYLILVMPDGSLVASGAITFAA